MKKSVLQPTKIRLDVPPMGFGQRVPPVQRGVPRPAPQPRCNDEVCDERYFVARWWRAPQAD